MTRGDRLIVAVVAALAVASWPVAILATGGASAGRTVTVDGPQGGLAVPLAAQRHLEVAGLGGHVEVVVRGGRVRVVASTCPDQLCVRQGAVSSGAIVCVPNGVSVKVGGGEDALDAYVR